MKRRKPCPTKFRSHLMIQEHKQMEAQLERIISPFDFLGKTPKFTSKVQEIHGRVQTEILPADET